MFFYYFTYFILSLKKPRLDNVRSCYKYCHCNALNQLCVYKKLEKRIFFQPNNIIGCLPYHPSFIKTNQLLIGVMARNRRCSSPDDDGYQRFTEVHNISYGSNSTSTYEVHPYFCNHPGAFFVDNLVV